jgi:hypothetical protein
VKDIKGLVLSDIAVTSVLKGPEDLLVIGEIIESSPRVAVVIKQSMALRSRWPHLFGTLYILESRHLQKLRV